MIGQPSTPLSFPKLSNGDADAILHPMEIVDVGNSDAILPRFSDT
jgi:hypothetical protein